MALRATVYRCDLTVSDLDRNVYGQYALVLARHPSETEERLMVRLLAYAMQADDALVFGPGLSTEDEPDLIRRDDTGAIDLWIDVGLPDEKAVRKACGRARQVVVFAYGARRVESWWQEHAATFARHDNLAVYTLNTEDTAALQRLAARAMTLNGTLQDGHVWLASADATVELVPQRVK